MKLAEFALKTHTLVTFLSGDVHCAAVGYFKSLNRDKKAPDRPIGQDHRYMLNVISSK